MNYTSLAFIGFFAVFIILYYALPKKVQWLVLLCGSLFFYTRAGVKLSIFIVFSTFVVYAGGLLIAKTAKKSESALKAVDNQLSSAEKKAKKKAGEKVSRRFLVGTLVLNLGVLLFAKYSGLFTETLNLILASGGFSLPVLQLALPLGISFYTFSLTGYLIDVYRKVTPAETNFLRLLTFSSYFPSVVQGPINRYGALAAQLSGAAHAFNYTDAAYGLQRMLWGFMKKLVIADRLGILVSAVYDNSTAYEGFTLVFATVCFAIQLYADFSGCMDIALGASQMLGIRLPENFKAPFFSHSIAEYWRRWHITLGAWFKDYVMYPLLKSRVLQGAQKRLAKPLGRKAAGKIITYTAMLVLWFLLGLWHGASWNFVIGTGLLHWAYMVLADAGAPLFVRAQKLLHIRTQSKTYAVFTTVRTFVLVCVGFVFFRANGTQGAFQVFANIFKKWNPWVLFDGSLLKLGIDGKDFIVLFVFIALLTVVDVQALKINVRECLAQTELPIRWAAYLLLFCAVLLFGIYGPAYDPTPFIYVRF